ncbi:MAG: nucleotidyltransferase domain-containing protein [Candidatus Eisenbacteria bacterium]|nr:nucleotidyltransferase domain-containing protein [Candidatus Eisenbacteria bacterium]
MDDVIVQSGPPSVPREQVIERIRSYLATTDVQRAILFGSYATGHADLASDLDLLLIERTNLPFVERGLAHLPLFRLGFGLDLLVYAEAELERMQREGNPLIARIYQEGIENYVRSEG